MLKPCVWSSYFFHQEIEQAVKEFIKGGIFYSELSDEHGKSLLDRGNPEKVGSELKKYADDLGFAFPQGHLWLSANICGDDSEAVIDQLKRWTDLYNAIGIKSAVLHSGKTEESSDDGVLLEKRVNGFTKLTGHIKGSQMTICLENLSSTTMTSKSLLEIINAVSSEHLGICLDTGHLNISGTESQYDFIKSAGSHLKALHIADNEGKTDQHLMPYGRGNIKWSEVMQGLKEINYDHMFNFEIPGENNAPIEILRSKLVHVRNLADYLIGSIL